MFFDPPQDVGGHGEKEDVGFDAQRCRDALDVIGVDSGASRQAAVERLSGAVAAVQRDLVVAHVAVLLDEPDVAAQTID